MITPKAINRKKRSSISLIKGFIVFPANNNIPKSEVESR